MEPDPERFEGWKTHLADYLIIKVKVLKFIEGSPKVRSPWFSDWEGGTRAVLSGGRGPACLPLWSVTFLWGIFSSSTCLLRVERALKRARDF